ncbi:MAG TPA: metal ABC transporter ATP-binding protein [Nitrososphaeraceae archaeon]|nr:metal ABC transporter ATP-binding protein [Nitrososphaeraceae archaeon]
MCDYTLNITIKNITYGYTPHKPVIENVSLLIPQGRFVGLLGPSGSGKSTLIKIIAGLFKPWSGSVQYSCVLQSGEETKKGAGRNMKEQNNYGIDQHGPNSYYDAIPTIRPKQVVMGYVPQIETVDWNFPVTVREVVSMGIWDRSGTSPFLSKDTLTEIDRILDDLGIHSHEFGKRQIRELSGGEQQRVFLARALIRSPNVLVLDEPISGVDHTTREKILGILTSLSREGLTIILTTHDLSGIAKRLPWVVCMNKKIIAEGTPSEVLTETNLLRTFGLMVEEKNDIGLNN